LNGAVVLLLGMALVVVAATATTFLLRPEGRIDACITWGVVAITYVVATMLLLGVTGLLRPGLLLAAPAAEAIVAVAVLARRGWPDVDVHALLPRSSPRQAPWEWALVALALLALGWQLLVALVLPPYAYDALTYHLTSAASWVQHGRIAPTPLSLCCAYYPGNAELPSAWLMVLHGRDALVGTVEIAAAVLGALAVAGIGRTAGLSRRGAVAAGALFLLTPAVLAQAPTPYVDVLQAALALCGLHGLARFAATARPSRLIVPALCAGLLIGTKGNGLLAAVGLVLSAAVIAIVHVRRGRLTGRWAGRAMAGMLGACVLLGGWWYLRNAIDKGNPMYPFELRVAGRTLFEGPLRVSDVLISPPEGAGRPWPVAVVHSWVADLLPWRHGTYDYQQRSGGLGPLWSWLGLLVIPLVILLWRRRSAALAAIVPIFAVFVVQPFHWWARFTLPLAAVGAIAVVFAAHSLRTGITRRALQVGVVGLALLGAVLVVAKVNPASRATPLPMSRVLGLVGASAPERSIGHLFFPEYRFLDELPDEATVVVDLDAPAVRFVYPLFGPRLQRTVVPAGQGSPPDSAWVVTSRGRPLDDQLVRSRAGPAFDEGGVRVWAPTA
jgi:hypothetical protein